jgi:uracil-DNA glycosylase
MKIYINVVNKKTQDNRPLKQSEIKEALPDLISTINAINPDKIITLGKTAENALRMIGNKSFHTMPHPSGRNRKLNDPVYVEAVIGAMYDYIALDLEKIKRDLLQGPSS